jgi:hypothetical protein
MAQIVIPNRYTDKKPPLGSQLNFGHELANGLVGCWLFNEGGGRIKDLLGLNNATTLGQGFFSTAIGLAKYLQSPSLGTIKCGTRLNNLPQLSLFLRLQYITYGGSGVYRQIIGNADNNTAPTSGWAVLQTNASGAGNRIAFFVKYDTTNYLIVTGNQNGFLLNGCNVVITWDGTPTSANGHIYINGFKDYAATRNDGVTTRADETGKTLCFGNNGTGNGEQVYMSTAYLWNRILKNAEIKDLFVAPYQFIAPPRRRFYSIHAGGAVTAALTGTVTTATEADIVAGGKTIILTLTNDTWIAAGGASFDLQRQNIINGLTSAQSEVLGWNLIPKLSQGVAGVVRTNNTTVTITLDAFPTYNITANETITATIPGTALSGGSAVVASPTFTITPTSQDYTRTHTAVLPTDNTDLTTVYSAQDYLDVASEDAVWVSVTGANNEYTIHQFKDNVGAATSTNLFWEGQTNAGPPPLSVLLEIYNVNTTAWVTLVTKTTATSNVDFILSSTNLSLTNYKNGSNVISCRVYQLKEVPTATTLKTNLWSIPSATSGTVNRLMGYMTTNTKWWGN